MIQSAGIKNWLGPRLTNRLFISLYNMFFSFVQQNKIWMIRIMTPKVLLGKYLLNGNFLTVLPSAVSKFLNTEPNQKSMMEIFSNNS